MKQNYTPNMEHDGTVVRESGYLRRPHVKLVYTKPTLLEAIKFEGGQESADQIIEWVRLRGGEAEYVVDGTASHSQYVLSKGKDQEDHIVIRITRPEFRMMSVGSGRWVVLQENGVFDQMPDVVFEDAFVVTTP